MTSHSVGGNSSTGAKLSARTYRGSTDGLTGGFMKLLIRSSNALKNLAGKDGSSRVVEGPFAIAGGGGRRGDGESAFVLFTVLGVSSVKTDVMAIEKGGREVEIGGERRRFPPVRKGEERASMIRKGVKNLQFSQKSKER